MRAASDLNPADTNGKGDKQPQDQTPSRSMLLRSAEFVRQYWRRLLVISALLLIPCFWHRRIEAGDLASHLYNAWLAQLIADGHAPGLWIARQWSNVLFDIVVARLGSMFGLAVAEKIAVSAAVLIFFWGMFALICAATRRVPWFVLPCLTMFAYGWTFNMGFLNFYIALGLSFLSLSIFWRGKGWERLAAVALVPLVLMAHPLGLVWLLGAAAYVEIAEGLPRRLQFLLPLAAIIVLLEVRHFVPHRYPAKWLSGPFYRVNGADQLILYGARYSSLAHLLLCFGVACLLVDVVTRRQEPKFWTHFSIPLQLYAVVELGFALVPEVVQLPQYAAPVGLVAERFSSVSAALACCLFGAMRPRKWHLAGFVAIAVAFFSFLYQDTAIVNGMEEQAERLVRALPPAQRVAATIWRFPGSRILVHHIVDRACIGHCFSYANYEASAGEFRVRALPGNPWVTADYQLSNAMESGTYVVRAEDLPMYQIYQCSLALTDLCIRSLEAGERNGRIGVQPAR